MLLYYLRHVANPRPVATIKKLATGRIVQWQVLTRTVGHSETSFLGRSGRVIWTGPVELVSVYETGLGFATCPWTDSTVIYVGSYQCWLN